MKKNMRKLLGLTLATVLTVTAVAACNTDETDETTTVSTTTTTTTTTEGDDDTTTTGAEEDTTTTSASTSEAGSDDTVENGATFTGPINVYSRDPSSGTREAFSDIIGIDEDAGALVETATITSGNGDQAAKVGQDAQAIGYVALTTDFEANNIRAVDYNGVEATEENVLDSSYGLYRPFSYLTRAEDDFANETEKDLTAAFIAFLTESAEGREAVGSAGGIVDVESGTPWAEMAEDHPVVNQDNSGVTLRTGGSTSVQNTLDAAIQAFQPVAGNVNIVTDQTGSSDGFRRTLGSDKDGPGAAHIGFASREFNEDEADHTNAMAYGEYSKDAVVVAVEMNNPVTNLTTEQILAIYTGEVITWDELGD